jgi:hypothetical protein
MKSNRILVFSSAQNLASGHIRDPENVLACIFEDGRCKSCRETINNDSFLLTSATGVEARAVIRGQAGAFVGAVGG